MFKVNYEFLCCVSDRYFLKEEKDVSIKASRKYISIISSFFTIFEGEPFEHGNFDYNTLHYLIELFDLKSLYNFISFHISLPQIFRFI
jgi:hypothetical protein